MAESTTESKERFRIEFWCTYLETPKWSYWDETNCLDNVKRILDRAIEVGGHPPSGFRVIKTTTTTVVEILAITAATAPGEGM